MRKMHHLAGLGGKVGTAVLCAALLAGCGGESPQVSPEPPARPSTAPSGSNAEGVTTAKDVFGPACQQQPQGGEPGSVVRSANLPTMAAIEANPQLRSLAAALKKAGLGDSLNKQPGVTVFAVYDRGWTNFQQRLGPDRYNALMADPNAIGEEVKYHLVVKRYDRAGLVAAKNVTTLQGGNLQIRDAGDSIEIVDNVGTTAHVLCGNIPTANGTIFLIDNVLQPKQP